MNVSIIGNGVAGNSAAESILSFDPAADITLISEEIFTEYSACALCDYISGELPERRVFLKRKQDYSTSGVKAILGKKVNGIDPFGKRIKFEDTDYLYDKLVLATGSEPILPSIDGIEKKGVFCLKSLSDAHDIIGHRGKKAVVIGSGPIGIEATVALKKRGYEVCLVELLGSILPKLLEKKCSSIVTATLLKNGVNVVVGEAVNEIYGGTAVEGVSTDKRQIRCDTVILSIGMQPRTELAKDCGIALGKHGGIKVNSRMETSLQDVYACGDCAESMLPGSNESVLSLLWFNAKQQGKVAGSNASGVNRQYPAPVNIIVLRVFDIYIASISNLLYTPDLKHEKLEKKFRDRHCTFVLHDGKMAAVQMVGKPDELGIFFPFLQKGETIEKMRKYVDSKVDCTRPLWIKTISHYLTR